MTVRCRWCFRWWGRHTDWCIRLRAMYNETDDASRIRVHHLLLAVDRVLVRGVGRTQRPTEMSLESHPEFVPEWDVYRDAGGNAVRYGRLHPFHLSGAHGEVFDLSFWTCEGCEPPTAEQLAAVRRAVHVWESVCAAEGSEQASRARREDGTYDWQHPCMMKSRLLHRLIHLGLPPTRTRPPLQVAGPAWWLLPGGDPFDPVDKAEA